VKACRQHPGKLNARWCSCRVGWRYRLALPDPVTGQRGRPQWSETFPTKDAADRDQRDVRKAIDEGTYTHDRGMTLDEYLREWLAGRERAGLKATTLSGYRDVIELYLVPTLGKHRAGALRPAHVQAMLDQLAQAPLRRKGGENRKVSAGTLVKVRAVLRAALADAMKRRMVAQNVATLVTLPAVRAPRPVSLDADRLARFLWHIPAGHPLACLWLLDATYGMRRGELLGLGWDDVDSRRQRLHVRMTLLEVEGVHPCQRCGDKHVRLLFDTPKSAAGERIYPLVAPIARALELQRERQAQDRASYGRLRRPRARVRSPGRSALAAVLGVT
jgi:integrase